MSKSYTLLLCSGLFALSLYGCGGGESKLPYPYQIIKCTEMPSNSSVTESRLDVLSNQGEFNEWFKSADLDNNRFPPPIDFAAQTVAFIALGELSTQGNDYISIYDVYEADKVILVEYNRTYAGTNCDVSQTPSYPYCFVKFDQSSYIDEQGSRVPKRVYFREHLVEQCLSGASA